jgi:hypothetical protein
VIDSFSLQVKPRASMAQYPITESMMIELVSKLEPDPQSASYLQEIRALALKINEPGAVDSFWAFPRPPIDANQALLAGFT